MTYSLARGSPSNGQPMQPNPAVVEAAVEALAESPLREKILAPWGLSYQDVTPYRLGLYKGGLTIPFYGQDGKLEGVKLRLLDKSHDDPDRFKWLTKGRAPGLYQTVARCLDGEGILVAEGPLKSIALGLITGKATTALPSGAQTGIPEHARELFRGRYVWLVTDADEAGKAAAVTLAAQLKGIARSLQAIQYPPPGWTFRGAAAADLNDVLRLLIAAYGSKWEWAQPGMREKILADLERAPDLLAEEAPQRLLSESAEDFLSGIIRPVEYAIENIWVVGNSGPIGGQEKVGKTWLVHEIVLSLATATPFLGKYRVKRKFRVLYWEEEDSRERTKRRGRQLLAGRFRARAQAASTLRYLVGHGLKIDGREGLNLLRAEIEAFRPEFVVVGNLREVHTKDENRPEMAHVRDVFRSLSREFGCAFILIHHFRKQQEGQSKRGSQMLAGSGIWGAWAEGWIWVTPGGSEDVMLLEVGSKDAAAGVGQIAVQRRDLTDGEPLAVDGDGRKVWPVILTEIESKTKSEESRLKVLEAVKGHFQETRQAASVKEVVRRTGLSRRTVDTYLPELEAEGLLQVVELQKNTKGYQPTQ